jgi:transcriptional regulator with XRE-family HTH domain
VRARREALGLTQEGLGELAQLHATYVSGIERGVRNPSLTIIAALADALECTIGALAD